jgi:hypothetical protein
MAPSILSTQQKIDLRKSSIDKSDRASADPYTATYGGYLGGLGELPHGLLLPPGAVPRANRHEAVAGLTVSCARRR